MGAGQIKVLVKQVGHFQGAGERRALGPAVEWRRITAQLARFFGREEAASHSRADALSCKIAHALFFCCSVLSQTRVGVGDALIAAHQYQYACSSWLNPQPLL